MEFSPVAHKYIRGYYKELTDKHLNLEEIRVGMEAKNISRTPHQLRYDLEERYPEFKGYAALHPAPRQAPAPKPPTISELAALDDAKKAKKTHRLEFKQSEDYQPGRRNSIADTIRRRQQEAGSAA